jgi:hypothetical protein
MVELLLVRAVATAPVLDRHPTYLQLLRGEAAPAE